MDVNRSACKRLYTFRPQRALCTPCVLPPFAAVAGITLFSIHNYWSLKVATNKFNACAVADVSHSAILETVDFELSTEF